MSLKSHTFSCFPMGSKQHRGMGFLIIGIIGYGLLVLSNQRKELKKDK